MNFYMLIYQFMKNLITNNWVIKPNFKIYNIIQEKNIKKNKAISNFGFLLN